MSPKNRIRQGARLFNIQGGPSGQTSHVYADHPRHDHLCRRLLISSFCLTLSALTVLTASLCDAQVVIRGGQRIQLRQFNGRVFGINQPSNDSVVDSGATLKTDPDLESILERAERHRQDGNYRAASHFWQAVLERSGDALFSSDGETYFSLVQQVEKTLAELPPEGLQVYRVTADANAKEIMAEAGDPYDVRSLSTIVRQYFISSLGDDAAYRLACIYMDKFDFIGARRMLKKIIDQYPDPSIPLDQIYIRIALCESYLGHVDAAKKSLAQAREKLTEVDDTLFELVDTSIGTVAANEFATVRNTAWAMNMGSSKRYGVMPRLPRGTMNSDLVAIWQYYFAPQPKYKWADAKGDTLIGEQAQGESALDTMTSSERKLTKSWRAKEWRPAGYLVFNKDKLFFKSAADITAWNRSGKADQPAWRPLWRNAFELDEATQTIINLRRGNWGYGRRRSADLESEFPSSVEEVQLFGDKIYQEMSICKDMIYTIEGTKYDDEPIDKRRRATPNYNSSFRRSRNNQLTAYDSETGIVQWTLPREPTDDDQLQPIGEDTHSPWLDSGGFMAAPIGFGNLIIVPVNHGGAISVYALDPEQQGKTVWKSFLCDEPETSAEPWSPIELSIEGSDLLVSPGMGVVFVLDPSTGLVRFARRYDRVGKRNTSVRRYGGNYPMMFSGWGDDVIVPYGSQMICFCSDTHMIRAFDRNDGRLIWESEMSPISVKVDYLLGVYDDILYAGGRETIVAYDLKGEGRMLWGGESAFGGKKSYGRGMLTPDGIYIPVGHSIAKFDLKGDKAKPNLLSQVHVDLGTDAPVGNLYSDGNRIWVHGANRVYALGPVDGDVE